MKRGYERVDSPHFGCPTNITRAKRKRILEVVDKNPRLILQDFINIVDIGFGHFMVDKILYDYGFCLKIPRKKSFLR